MGVKSMFLTQRRNRHQLNYLVRKPLPVSLAISSLLVKYVLFFEVIQSKPTATAAAAISPVYEGCLYNHLPDLLTRRVCNSEDDSDAAARGYCRESAMRYDEIRIIAANWESATFNAWILQILFSELLDVPTTIEASKAGVNANLYNPQNTFEFGTIDHWTAFETASNVIDCRKVDNENRNSSNYQPCAHFNGELWSPNYAENVNKTRSKIIELPQPVGVIGRLSWYIPKFTAERYNGLFLSYLGFQNNREKIAKIFKRPTTWGDYCSQVSLHQCKKEDGTAARAPQNDDESKRYFVDGLYTGYFRLTEENDCSRNPNNCTGHIADFPCDWTSLVTIQTHHLNIPLTSSGDNGYAGGYDYGRLLEIWQAANATKSDVVMYWWEPDAFYSSFVGTDAEFVKVALPPPTQECARSRKMDYYARCQEDWKEYLGPPESGCDDEPNTLKKALSTGFDKLVNDPSLPSAIRSPAYEAAKSFTISSLQYSELLGPEYYGKTPDNPREAVCQWFVDNIEYMSSFVPVSYPRSILVGKESYVLFYSSIAVAALSCCMVIITAFALYERRHKRVVVYAQVSFLWLIVCGLFIVSLGAIVVAIGGAQTQTSCIIGIWFINFGYTLVLVPPILKAAAINHLLHAAKQFRRAKVKKESLFGVVFFVGMVVIIFLSIWTAQDPPRVDSEYDLTENLMSDGRTTIVFEYFYCHSNSPLWDYICVGWNAILLICATVLAFQMRTFRSEFNESQSLAIMIYSHAIFLVLRVATYFLSDGIVKGAVLMRIRVIIFSIDIVATIAIYFIPKLMMNDDRSSIRTSRSPTGEASRIFPINISNARIRNPGECQLCRRPFNNALDTVVSGWREDSSNGSNTAHIKKDGQFQEIVSNLEETADSSSSNKIKPNDFFLDECT